MLHIVIHLDATLELLRGHRQWSCVWQSENREI